MRRILLIDGENIKGKIRSVFALVGKQKPMWPQYDFRGLLDTVLAGTDFDRQVFYFARIKEHEDSLEKSKALIEEQRQLKSNLEKSGFEVVISGRVRGQYEKNRDGTESLIFREKGVDVKIAVDMVSLACDKKVDEIVLASSDSDLQPAIKEVRERSVACTYLGFEAQPNKGLTFTTYKTILIRDAEVLRFESAQKQLL